MKVYMVRGTDSDHEPYFVAASVTAAERAVHAMFAKSVVEWLPVAQVGDVWVLRGRIREQGGQKMTRTDIWAEMEISAWDLEEEP